MMRRARISVKPNFRPGGRSVPAGQETSQTPTDANNTPPRATAEEAVKPPSSPQRKPSKEEPAKARGVETAPSSPSEEASADLNNGAHSSCTTTPAAVPQRRMRVSATPKLVGPKATSTPRPSTKMPRSAPSTLPKEAASGSANSVSLPESSTSSSTTPTEVTIQSSKSHAPSSPCVPSTSGLLKPQVHKKLSVEDSPPSPQPGQVPEQPLCDPEPQKCPTSESDMPSSYVKLSRFDEPGSPQKGTEMSSDTEKILRALKLKALMKIERRKDIVNEKRRSRRRQEYTSLDRSKMTMKDLIYYLPNTSPMRYVVLLLLNVQHKGSTVGEENEEVIVPPSPSVPEKKQETEEEEEEECEDQDMLVPKVRVAEDGSIILDEESLTVRVQRNSNTKVVENSTALFERGSTTTYTSFRSLKHVKSWSVRETDMFFLAISMVGTDFSLIGQLLPHRSRVEIKNKFKKEEKANAWRIDKAFRNKRPYDREFFSFLLKKVLAKDKKKGKSVKLVMTTPRKRGKARGQREEEDEEEYLSASGEDEDFDMEDGCCVEAEKENQSLPTVNKAENSVPTKKKRRSAKMVSEDKDKEGLSEEQGKKKKKSKRRKTKEAMHLSEIDGEGESGLFNADSNAANDDLGDELNSSTSAPKKRRKCSDKKGKEETQDETVEKRKGKRRRTSLKVAENPDDSIDATEEHGIADEDDSAATTKKRKRSQKSNSKEGRPGKEKKSTKRKKSRKGEHQSFKSDAGNDRKPMKGAQQWSDVGKLRKVEDETGCSVLNKLQGPDGPQRKTSQDIAVIRKAMRSDYFSKRKSVKRKEKRTQHRALRDTGGEPTWSRRGPIPCYLIVAVLQVGLKPLPCSAGDSKVGTVEHEGTTEDGEPSVTAEGEEASIIAEASVAAEEGESSEAKKMDTLVPAEVKNKPPQRSSKQPNKPRPNLATRRCKKTLEPEATADDEINERRNENNDVPSEVCVIKVKGDQEVDSLKAEHLCKQAVVVLERTPPRMLSPSNVQRHSNESETSSLPTSPALAESSSNQQIRMERAERVRRSLTTDRTKGKGKAVMDQNEAEHDPGASAGYLESPTILPEQMVTEDTETENSLDENLIDFSCLHHLDSHLFQRRPMLVLSREEVDMILTVQDQTADEDPSVSPLDLSLNSELSFSLRCSNLMEENPEAERVESSVEEHGGEILPQEMASSSVGLEERYCEDMGSTEPVLGQYQISAPTTSEDVITTAKELEGCPTSGSPAALQIVASLDPIHTKPDAPVAVTHVASLASQGDPEDSNTPLLLTSEIKETTQGSVLASSEVLGNKEGSQGFISATPEIKEGSQESISTGLEIKESKMPAPVFKDDFNEDDLTSEVLEKSETSVVVTSGNKEELQQSVVATPESKERPDVSVVAPPAVGKDPKVQAVIPSLCKTVMAVLSEHSVICLISSTKSSSGASGSSELGASLKRRSRFPKAKPNLGSASKITHSSLNQKNTEPGKSSFETILPQSTGKDQHCDWEDLSRPQFSKEEACTVDALFESAKGSPTSLQTPFELPVDYSVTQIDDVLSDASLRVLEQENIIALNLSAARPEDSHATKHSSSTCDLDMYVFSHVMLCHIMLLHCATVAEDPHTVNTSCIGLPFVPTAEQDRKDEQMDNFEELCAPAKIIQPTGDANNEEEPTIILTLYEVPVTEAYPASASNDPVITSPLLFSDQPLLPSVAQASSDSFFVKTGGILKGCTDISQNEFTGTMALEEESYRTVSVLEENTVSGTAVPNINLTGYGFGKHLCRLTMVSDSMKLAKSCPRGMARLVLRGHIALCCTKAASGECSSAVSNMMFTVTEEPENGPSLPEDKVPARLRGRLQSKLVQRTSGKEDSSTTDQPKASRQTIAPQTKHDSSTDLADLEMEDLSDASKLRLASTAKEGSGLDPLQGKHLPHKLQITPCTVSLSRCVGSTPQDSCKYPCSEHDVSMEQTASEEVADILSRKDTDIKTPDRRPASPEIKLPIRRRGKLQVKPKLRVRQVVQKEIPTLPQCKLEAPQSDPVQTISTAPQNPEFERQASKTSKLVTEDTVVKCDMESSSEDKADSLSAAHEEANLQSRDCMPCSVERAASCYDSSLTDSEDIKKDCEVVSHVVLADIFVPVSEEMGDELKQEWLVPTESNPLTEDFILPKKEEAQDEEKPERSKESTKPIRRKDKQKMSTAKLEELDILDSPKVPDPEAKDSSGQVNAEEELQRRHQTMPCTVRVSRCTAPLPVEEIKAETEDVLKTEPVSEEVEGNLGKNVMQVKNAASPSEESRQQTVLEEIRSEEATVKRQRKSPSRKKCKLTVKFPFVKQTVKKTESSKSSSPVSDVSVVNLPQTVSQTRQLTITAWTKKKPNQTDLAETSQMDSSLQATGSSPLPSVQHALHACSKPQLADSKETGKTSEDVSHIALVSAAEDVGLPVISSTKMHEVETADISPKIVMDSNEEPSGSQINKSPARRRVIRLASFVVVFVAIKKDPATTSKQNPATSSEETENEPSKVSQFFLCDIFTEVEDGD
ncbi:hypothetical protein NFI96_013043 [Prochilodus magdalenae]|nr:hypothetical protein NFI96_013043 [Prochilodus magdalenae]